VKLVDEKTISRGMVRVEPGEDLIDALEALAQAAGWRDGYVTGAGVLELVELANGPDGSTTTLENAELASLSGRIAYEHDRAVARLRATVIVEGTLHCGRIVAAMTGQLLLVVEAVGDGAATEAAGATRTTTNMEAARPGSPPESPSASTGLSRVEADSPRSATKPVSQTFSTKPIPKRLPSSPGNRDENPEVEPGDLLTHPQLGICEVVGDDASGGTRIRVPSGRVRVLRLDALQVLAGEKDEQGRTVFQVAGPRRRY
jgi:predicted DNA-binding protein with PD1-like motif